MALSRPPPLIAVALFLLLACCFASSSATATHLSSPLNRPKSSEMSIWELLESKRLPPGIIPDAVETYTFEERTGRLEINLRRPCDVQYDFRFQYEPRITGTLRSGSITELHGIQIYHHKPFNVRSIHARNEAVMFQLGHITLNYPESYFMEIRTCNGAIVSSLRNTFAQWLI